MLSRRTFAQSCALTLAAGETLLAYAQPKKKLLSATLMTGFPEGGPLDKIARMLAQKLSGPYATKVDAVNVLGAGGSVAVAALKNGAIDGSSLLLSPISQVAVFPHTYSNLPYVVTDVVPVAIVGVSDFALAVGPLVPLEIVDLKSFFDWLLVYPERANFASPAVGATTQLVTQLAATMASFSRPAFPEFKHIEYSGVAPVIKDLLEGKFTAASVPLGSLLPLLKIGKVRILAQTGLRRTAFAPDIPTFKEQGFPLALRDWYGLYLPATASPEVVKNAAVHIGAALSSSDMQAMFKTLYVEYEPSTPESSVQRLLKEANEWKRLIKIVNFKAIAAPASSK